jgi:hypothetical protein
VLSDVGEPGESDFVTVSLIRSEALESLGRAVIGRAAELGRRSGAATAFAEALLARDGAGMGDGAGAAAAGSAERGLSGNNRNRNSSSSDGDGEGGSDGGSSDDDGGGGRGRARRRRRGRRPKHRPSQKKRAEPIRNAPAKPSAGNARGERLRAAASLFPCPGARDVVRWVRDAGKAPVRDPRATIHPSPASASPPPSPSSSSPEAAAAASAADPGGGRVRVEPHLLAPRWAQLQLAGLVAAPAAALYRAERRRSLNSARAEIASTGRLAGVLVDRESAELADIESRACAEWGGASDALLRASASLSRTVLEVLLPNAPAATTATATATVTVPDTTKMTLPASLHRLIALTRAEASAVSSIASCMVGAASCRATLASLAGCCFGLAARFGVSSIAGEGAGTGTGTAAGSAFRSAGWDGRLPVWMAPSSGDATRREREPGFPSTASLTVAERRSLAATMLSLRSASLTTAGVSHSDDLDVSPSASLLSALSKVSDALAELSERRANDAEEDQGVSDAEFDSLRSESFACKATRMAVGALTSAPPLPSRAEWQSRLESILRSPKRQQPSAAKPPAAAAAAASGTASHPESDGRYEGRAEAGAGTGVDAASAAICRLVRSTCERLGVVSQPPSTIAAAAGLRDDAVALLAEAAERLGVSRSRSPAASLAQHLLHPAQPFLPAEPVPDPTHAAGRAPGVAEGHRTSLAWIALAGIALRDGGDGDMGRGDDAGGGGDTGSEGGGTGMLADEPWVGRMRDAVATMRDALRGDAAASDADTGAKPPTRHGSGGAADAGSDSGSDSGSGSGSATASGSGSVESGSESDDLTLGRPGGGRRGLTGFSALADTDSD